VEKAVLYVPSKWVAAMDGELYYSKPIRSTFLTNFSAPLHLSIWSQKIKENRDQKKKKGNRGFSNPISSLAISYSSEENSCIQP
jgi:hypothetical protein